LGCRILRAISGCRILRVISFYFARLRYFICCKYLLFYHLGDN